MQPKMEGGCFRTGNMWSFRSEASDDLDRIYEMLSDIPRCDTKTEIIILIRRAISELDTMQRRVKRAGTDYLIKDYDGDDCPDTVPARMI